MSAYLKVVNGRDRKAEFPLTPSIDNLIGRGRECHIQLDDPRASRLHAKFVYQEGHWVVYDASSRNGTLVNGSKTDTAVLADGCTICIGDTELVFLLHDLQESATWEQINFEEALVPLAPAEMFGIESKDFGLKAFESLRTNQREQELSALHEFSFKSNSFGSEQELVEKTMELLSARTGADAVAFLLSNELGSLDLAGQLSADPAYKPQISQQLSDIVLRKRRAVWLHQETDSPEIARGVLGKKPGFADAICVPLIDKDRSLGALHIYSQKRKFQRSDVDFAIALASIVGITLVRVLSSQSLQAELGRLQIKNADFNELLGNSHGMVELKDRICRIARASGCVLVRGESGAGKELVARAIHRNSQRASRPMLSVNCAAIPDELMESQLFGHVKGAFTGAERDHVGYFQQANKGTLFLDEVGELNLEGQAKLLRILEGHPFLPVGATQELRVDVRVISATNRDLREFVAEKRFREDLYYRLSVFELHIPPLRERGNDIDMLVELFLDHFKKQNGRKNLKISSEAMSMLRSYSWPGNVRQLRNVIDSAVVLADGSEIVPRDLSLRDVRNIGSGESKPASIDLADPLSSTVNVKKIVVDQAQLQVNPEASAPKAPVEGDFDTLSVDVWEQRLIQEAMRRTQGNIPAAAELMGISRATLYRKLDKSQLPPGSLPPDPDA